MAITGIAHCGIHQRLRHGDLRFMAWFAALWWLNLNHHDRLVRKSYRAQRRPANLPAADYICNQTQAKNPNAGSWRASIQIARTRKKDAMMVSAVEMVRAMNEPMNVNMTGANPASEPPPSLGSPPSSLTKSSTMATAPVKNIAKDTNDSSVAHPVRSRLSIQRRSSYER